MLFKYTTAAATLAQFIVLSFLNFASGIDSIVRECHKPDGDCATNIFVTSVYIILIVGWFAFLWVVGFTAQDRRSKRLAQLLIAAEGLVALIAAFNARNSPHVINFVTSLTDLVFALWIMILAFRLMLAKGGRVVSSGRARQRKRPTATGL